MACSHLPPQASAPANDRPFVAIPRAAVAWQPGGSRRLKYRAARKDGPTSAGSLATNVHQVLADSWLTPGSKAVGGAGAGLSPNAAANTDNATNSRAAAIAQEQSRLSSHRRGRSSCREAVIRRPERPRRVTAFGQTRPRRARPRATPGARSSPKPGPAERACKIADLRRHARPECSSPDPMVPMSEAIAGRRRRAADGLARCRLKPAALAAIG